MKAKAARQPYAVSIHHHGRLMKNIAQHQIGGLSADTGQTSQLLSGVRNLSAKFIPQHLAHRDNISGLCFI